MKFPEKAEKLITKLERRGWTDWCIEWGEDGYCFTAVHGCDRVCNDMMACGRTVLQAITKACLQWDEDNPCQKPLMK